MKPAEGPRILPDTDAEEAEVRLVEVMGNEEQAGELLRRVDEQTRPKDFCGAEADGAATIDLPIEVTPTMRAVEGLATQMPPLPRQGRRESA